MRADLRINERTACCLLASCCCTHAVHVWRPGGTCVCELLEINPQIPIAADSQQQHLHNHQAVISSTIQQQIIDTGYNRHNYCNNWQSMSPAPAAAADQQLAEHTAVQPHALINGCPHNAIDYVRLEQHAGVQVQVNRCPFGHGLCGSWPLPGLCAWGSPCDLQGRLQVIETINLSSKCTT